MKEKIKKILQSIGMGGLVMGGVGASLIVHILQIIFVWGAGLSTVLYGITLILNGSTFWGLIVLFIGTPIAVSITSFLFPFFIFFLIIALIIGLFRWLF